MTCLACQSSVPDGARFCPQCGSAVASAAAAPRELRKTVTVLFCDMADSTALSGRLDPESLREVMVRYYALMRDCLERHGGTVEKFIGDAVVAVFGVPVLHEDDAQRALHAALEMLSAVQALNSDLRTLIGVEIGIRIGVNTGEVVAAEDAQSGQVLAAGEVMNVAARFQQHAAPGQVILGPVTRILAAGDFACVSVGDLTLKGKAEPVPAWRLAGTAPPAAGRFADSGLPFFGRTAELAQLREGWAQAVSAASGQLVLLQGEAGVGKTRLAAELAAQAGELGGLVGTGRCRPYGEGRPLLALGEALRQIVDAARDDGVLGAAHSPDVGEALAYLGTGLLRDGSPGELPGQLAWAAALVLETIGRRRPVLLIVDDLHAAKPVLLDFLDQMVGRIAGAPVLVLGVGRLELLEEPPDWVRGRPGVSVLSLEPLSTEEAGLFLAALTEVAAHRAGLTEQIIERAGGNPFFLEQLAAITDQFGTDALPPTVQSVIAARLDLLDQAEHEVLLRAAVPGSRFSAPELGALLGAEPPVIDPPERVLSVLTRRRLIEAERSAAGYRFCGVLIRDVAYNTLSKRARLHYHEVLARWYRRRTQSLDLAGLHLERAYHLVGELHPADRRVQLLRTEAAQTLALAGARALRSGDLHWAADLLARAHDLHDAAAPERTAVGVHLAEARLLLGADPHAQQTLLGLANQAAAAGDQRTASHARLLLAALELPGPSAVADALATVPVFEAAGDHLGLARAWLRVAQLRQLGGRYQEAEDVLRRALRHALRADAQLELATIIGGLATSLWRGPAPVKAALAGCRALLAEHGAGHRAARATANCPQAVLLGYRGEYGTARALVQDSIRIIQELGHAYGAATMTIFAAAVEGLAGRWDTAEELLREAAESSRGSGDALSFAAAAAALARACLEQGHYGAALDTAESLAATGDPFLDAEIYGVRARVLAARGDQELALGAVEQALAAAAVTDSTVCQAAAELDRAHVLRACGDPAAGAAAAAAGQLYRAKGHLVGMRWAASFGAPALAAPPSPATPGHQGAA
ncbi:MAG TPA: adenylate/guanylate cyclase domain-containing protein [Streptosporangiaceae bacterium]|nr:adenylate/guanylate cyclase domain-containing protein [Streptosporangiaceae bacterium]